MSPVIDCHNDSIVSRIRRGFLSVRGGGEPGPRPPDGAEGTVAFLRGPLPAEERPFHGQIDLASMRAGGIDAAFFAVDVTRAWKNHLAYALDALGWFLADLETCGGELVVARSAEDIRAARAAGKRAALLVVENSEALEGSLHVLRSLHALGVRSVGLTHNLNTWAAAGNAEAGCGGGLTRFGRALVREMGRLRMLVDVSHIAERGFYDTLEEAGGPVIASHSCCAALCPHPRNLSDSQLRALAQTGGVVGITFVAPFLDAGWRESHWPERPGLDRVLAHVDHAVSVAGVDHVGIGSDFDGGGVALRDATEYPRIAEALRARGYSEADVDGIMGGNVLRLLRETLG